MTAPFAATLTALGVTGAFVSGLLGVGGAIVMIPLLLYVPPLLGVGALDVKAVLAVTMAQVFVAALAGMLAHRRQGAVNAELAWVGGAAMGLASFAGAFGSRWAPERGLLVIFALMATGALALMLAPVESLDPSPRTPAARYSRARIVLVCVGVGVAAGLVGAGGAFLLVPLLLVVVGVPLRVTIGSSLAITALASTAGLIGKVVTGQLPPWPTVAVLLGAVPGAQLGAAVSRRLPARVLRLALFAVVLASALRVWWDVLARP